MKIRNWIYFLLIPAMLLSCKREETFELSPPTLLVDQEGVSEIVQEPGNDVFLNFSLQAARGIREFVILKDGVSFLTVPYEDQISATYSFEYAIPADTDIGTETVFTFELYDQDGKKADHQLKLIIRRTFGETDEVINGVNVKVIKGRVNSDFTMTADQVYVIDSTFSIENNSTLTIEQGSTVYFRTYSDPNLVSRLVISRGARIVAEGTAASPIVFTSDKVLLGQTPTSQDWGGITLYGNAPTNQGSVVIDGSYRYGGTRATESSGSLRYIRIEYVGKGGTGVHGLTLNSVGSGTLVEYIQVFNGDNTSFRLRGGRVNLKYIAGIGHGGYGIWADGGWQGNGQFWIFQTNRQATLVPVNFWNIARSIEFRNDDNNFSRAPITQFRLANITLIGNGYEPNGNNGTRRGVRVRTGSRGHLYNMLVTEFPDEGVRVEDLPVETLGNEILIDNVRSYNNRIDFAQDAEWFFFESGNYNILNTSTSGVTLNNFVGSEPSGFNPSSIGTFFSSAPFIGAVENTANDWTVTGTWFKNMDGTIR